MTTWKQYRQEWIKHNTCKFCRGNNLHTCLGYRCQDAIRSAEGYFDSVIEKEEIRRMNRKYITDILQWFTEKMKVGSIVTGAWVISDGEKKEIVVRFDSAMSKIERSMAARLIEKRCAEAVIRENAKDRKSDFINLLEGAVLREWGKADEAVIRSGIPHEIYGWKKLISDAIDKTYNKMIAETHPESEEEKIKCETMKEAVKGMFLAKSRTEAEERFILDNIEKYEEIFDLCMNGDDIGFRKGLVELQRMQNEYMLRED